MPASSQELCVLPDYHGKSEDDTGGSVTYYLEFPAAGTSTWSQCDKPAGGPLVWIMTRISTNGTSVFESHL